MARPFVTPPSLTARQRVGRFESCCVDDEPSIEALFRKRHEVFHAEMKLAGALAATDIERDAIDERSAHIACFDDDGEIAGYSRLIYGAPALPTLVIYGVEREFASTTAEVSRLIVAPRYRSSDVASKLIRSSLWSVMFRHARANGITSVVASGRPALFNALRASGIAVERLDASVPVNLFQFGDVYRDFFRGGEVVPMRATLVEASAESSPR
jgi:N-acyl-L-homoserine lactone synthetase